MGEGENSTYSLVQIGQHGAIMNKMDGVRSAVCYFELVLALTEHSILLLDEDSFKIVNEITLNMSNFDEDIQVNKFRMIWANEPIHDNGLVLFIAYFNEENDFDNNIGQTMMVHIS
jgi:hypothetical protein